MAERLRYDSRARTHDGGLLSSEIVRDQAMRGESEVAQLMLDGGFEAREIRELIGWAMARRIRENGRPPWGVIIRSMFDLKQRWETIRADMLADAGGATSGAPSDPYAGIPITRATRGGMWSVGSDGDPHP